MQKSRGKITGEMRLIDVLGKYPKTADIFLKFGMHCINCPVASMEKISEAAKVHNIDEKKLLKKLNEAIEQ